MPPEQDARLRGAASSNASFDKDYVLGRQLGSGAYAVVYECTNRVGGWVGSRVGRIIVMMEDAHFFKFMYVYTLNVCPAHPTPHPNRRPA